MNLDQLKGTKAGRSLFILGSGPSLLENNLSLLLAEECHVMALNYNIYFLDWSTDQAPLYWTFVDWREEFKLFLPAALHRGITVFMHTGFHPQPDHPNLVPVNICDTPGHCLYAAIDYALGIAVLLGYKRVYLIGFDRGPYKGKGHATLPEFTNSYTWVDLTIRRHQPMIDIVGCGAHCGIPFIPHVSLAEAFMEVKNGK